MEGCSSTWSPTGGIGRATQLNPNLSLPDSSSGVAPTYLDFRNSAPAVTAQPVELEEGILGATAPQSSISGKRENYSMLPLDDLDWILTQKPAVVHLFLECWRSDPYGSRWMPLTTSLKNKTLKQAKSVLRKSGLFDFKSEMKILEGNRYYETFVFNLHGSRRWHPGGVVENPSQGNKKPQVGVSTNPGGVKKYPPSSTQTQSEQGFQNASISSQYLFINNSISPTGALQENAVELKDDLEEEKETNQAPENFGELDTPEALPVQSEAEVVPAVEEREVLIKLRQLGVEINEGVRATMKNKKANVANALAHIKQRYDARENFGNITGAFVKACQDGAKPYQSTRSQINPPTSTQLTTLEEAKAARTIRDYYLAPWGEQEVVLVDTGRSMQTWWQFLADCER